MNYLGDFADNETVRAMWATNDSGGGSITRSTKGTVYVQDLEQPEKGLSRVNSMIPAGSADATGFVVTTADHGLATGDDVMIYDVGLTTTINGNIYRITKHPGEVARNFVYANSEYLESASAVSELESGYTDWTVAFWVYPNDDGTNFGLVSKYSGTSMTSEYSIEMATDRTIFVRMTTGSTETILYFGAISLTEAAWNFVAVEHDNGTHVKLTINSNTQTVAYTGGVNSTDTPFRIGWRAVSAQYFDGRIAMAGYWTRLLAGEVAILENVGVGLVYSQLSSGLKNQLVSYWDLNEANGNASDPESDNTLTDTNTVTSAAGPGTRGFTLDSTDVSGWYTPSLSGSGNLVQVNTSQVTDTKDAFGVVGHHSVLVSTGGDDYFDAGRDYTINLKGAVIDSQTVDTVIAQFSIANRAADTTALATSAETLVINGKVDDILVDTGTTLPATLSTIDSEIGTVDTVVDAIKVTTDKMVFTASNQLDVQVISMATNSLTASAAAADFIGAAEIAASASAEIADLIAADWVAGDASPLAIVAALKADSEWSSLATITSALATVDTVVDQILVDTAVIGVAGAGLTDLGGMSTGMKAEVEAEAVGALADYDSPTNTEMEARTLPSASYFDPAADTVASVTLVGTTTTVTNTVNANLEQISGSNIVETSSGRIVGNFNTFYDNDNAVTTSTVDDVSTPTVAIVGPVQTVTSPGNFVGSPTTLQIFQKESRVVSFSVVDGSGTVVDLSGLTLRFMVITDSNTPTAVFKVDSGNITISGSSNEVVTVSISAVLSDIAVADHVWRLWDVNNSDVYAHGAFQVLPALADTV